MKPPFQRIPTKSRGTAFPFIVLSLVAVGTASLAFLLGAS